jgi:hypothetical protein
MLRGLDTRGASADYEPTIVKVADRPTVADGVTLYVEAAPDSVTYRRFRAIAERLSFFAEAGIVPLPTVVRWSTGDTEGAGSPPDICLVFRRDGRLSGLYPRVAGGHVRTIEECLTALAAGNDVENVDY